MIAGSDVDLDPPRAIALATALSDGAESLSAAKSSDSQRLTDALIGSTVPVACSDALAVVDGMVESITTEYKALSQATLAAVETFTAADGATADGLAATSGLDR